MGSAITSSASGHNAWVQQTSVRGHKTKDQRGPTGPLVVPDASACSGSSGLVARSAGRAGQGGRVEPGTSNIRLLNVLADAIPARERVVTIEDVAELKLPGPHVVRLEARPPNVEGRGEVPLRELVRNALRMRPDRIVVGEVRGPEVLDMLQAANTGHHGLMTTLHAGSPEEVPARLEAMALTAPGAGLEVVRRLVAGGIGAVVHLERTSAGDPRRRVAAVAELVTTNDGRSRAIPLRTAGPTAGPTAGLTATGHVPRWANRLDPAVLPAFEPTDLAGRVRVLCPRSRTR